MTNFEYWLGTPEKAAKVIQSVRRFANDMSFEKAWLDWYSERWVNTDPEDMPSVTECMAEFLRSEHKRK